MGQIQINTSSGPVRINIAGDAPTEEEQQYILDNIDKITPQKSGVASPQQEEISNYYRKLRQKQSLAETTAKENVEEVSKKTQKVDIDTSGIKHIGLRADLAQAENDKEYELRLNRAGFKEDQYFKDPEKGYVIRLDKVGKDLKKKYGLPEKGNLSVEDEDWFTKQDFAEFFSMARGPLIGGIAASFAASGFGLPVAALIVGGGSAAGYLFDEALEYREKVQAQDSRSVTKHALIEAFAGIFGEGVGRGITALLGRFIKGPATKEANEVRTLMRKAVTEDARPTVRGANLSPILGRLQAIYEGVMPNQAMAKKNAQFVANRLVALSPKKLNTDDIIKILNDDITRIYGTPKELLDKANKDMKELLDTEMDNLIKAFGSPDQEGVSTAAKGIEIAKRTFDEDTQVLYERANELLGGAKVINIKNFIRGWNKIVKKNAALQLDQKGLGQVISALAKSGDKTVDVSTIQSIRTALRHATFDKDLVGTPEDGILRELTKLIDEAFVESEAVAKSMLLEGKDPVTGRFIKGFKNKKLSDADKAKYESMKDGFNFLREAQEFYKNGVQKFQQTHASELFKQYKRMENFDPDMLYDPKYGLIVPGNGTMLKNFLKTVVPSSRDPIKPPVDMYDMVPNIIVEGVGKGSAITREAEELLKAVDAGGVPSSMTSNLKRILQANKIEITGQTTPEEGIAALRKLRKSGPKKGLSLREVIRALPEDDPLKMRYKNMYEKSIQFADEIRAARIAQKETGDVGESVRRTMAASFLNKEFNAAKDIFGNVNAAKVSEKIFNLGGTGKVLFGDEYDKVLKVLKDMQSGGTRITPEDLDALRLQGLPITQQLDEIGKILGQEKSLSNIDVVKGIEKALAQDDPDLVVDAIFKKNSAAKIRMAKETLNRGLPEGQSSEAMEQIKDLSMSRILSVMGEPDMSSAEFVEAVFSGKAAGKLRSKLDSFDKATLNEMFGKETVQGLYDFARVSTLVSQEPIKGLGALAPASIAASLGIVGIIMDPITTLTTFAGIAVMSRLLRSKPFLKLITRPTGVRPTWIGKGDEYDKIGRGLEMVYEAMAQVGAAEATSDEQPPASPGILSQGYDAIAQQIPKASQVTSKIPNIIPPAAASTASRVNPILVPDPTTRATFGG